jgi:hypothetical protein
MSVLLKGRRPAPLLYLVIQIITFLPVAKYLRSFRYTCKNAFYLPNPFVYMPPFFPFVLLGKSEFSKTFPISRLSTTSDCSLSHQLNDVGDVQQIARIQEASLMMQQRQLPPSSSSSSSAVGGHQNHDKRCK